MVERNEHPGMQQRRRSRNVLLGSGAVVALAFLFSSLTRSPDHGALLGKPAPNVSLDLLDGGTLDLKRHAGEVVFLEFWATWCPPCRVSMPIADRIAEEYEDRGVRLYLVNEGEPRRLVEDFARNAGFHAPIALDTDRSLGRAFRVEGLPSMAIVGRDGTVRTFRAGLSPEIESELRADLESALAE